jgi:hypothetical protein
VISYLKKMAMTGSCLTSRFRLMTSWDKLDYINFHVSLIHEIGHYQWEHEMSRNHRIRMKFFDVESKYFEKNAAQEDMDDRRFLLVQLSTEHYSMMAHVMQLYNEDRNA